jgi:hypothetical protein
MPSSICGPEDAIRVYTLRHAYLRGTVYTLCDCIIYSIFYLYIPKECFSPLKIFSSSYILIFMNYELQ